MPTPPRDERGRFLPRPKPDLTAHDNASDALKRVTTNSSASRRPLPPTRNTWPGIVHDPMPEPRRRVWPRIVPVVLVAMAAVIGAVVYLATRR